MVDVKLELMMVLLLGFGGTFQVKDINTRIYDNYSRAKEVNR